MTLCVTLSGCTGVLGNSSEGGDSVLPTGDSRSASDVFAPGDPNSVGDLFLPGDDFQPAGDTATGSSECENWQVNHSEWIWCDDFEIIQELSVNYNDVSTNGMAITSEDPFRGQSSLRQRYDTAQVDAGWVSRFYADALGNNYGPTHDTIFARWYHKFEDDFEGMPPKMARVVSLGAGWDKRFSVLYWVAADSPNLEIVADVHVPFSTQANSSGWLALARSNFYYSNPANIGRWTCHEMEVTINTSGQTDGAYRYWVDDDLIIERVGVDLRGSTDFNFNEVMLDCYWNGGSPKVQHRYYDNFVISTERIGCLP